MSKAFLPTTTIPGATRVMMPDMPGVPLRDKHGRQVWDVPTRHSRLVRHFRSMAARLAYRRGEMSYADATHEVRIYRGIPARAFNRLRGDIRREARKADKMRSLKDALGVS